jgi:hypothetical protein
MSSWRGEYPHYILIAITPFGPWYPVFPGSYFRNFIGPDFGPFGGSAGGPFSLVADVPFLGAPFLTRCGATVFTGGGVGRLRVMTLPRGFPPLGIIPNLKGPS